MKLRVACYRHGPARSPSLTRTCYSIPHPSRIRLGSIPHPLSTASPSHAPSPQTVLPATQTIPHSRRTPDGSVVHRYPLQRTFRLPPQTAAPSPFPATSTSTPRATIPARVRVLYVLLIVSITTMDPYTTSRPPQKSASPDPRSPHASALPDRSIPTDTPSSQFALAPRFCSARPPLTQDVRSTRARRVPDIFPVFVSSPRRFPYARLTV